MEDFKEVFGGKYEGRDYEIIHLAVGNELPEDYFYNNFYFHPNGVVQVVTKDDDNFLGFRANHFVLVEGWVEDTMTDAFLLICNHKGNTEIIAYVFK